MERFHTTNNGRSVFQHNCRGDENIPRCQWRVRKCSTLSVEDGEVIQAARWGCGSVPLYLLSMCVEVFHSASGSGGCRSVPCCLLRPWNCSMLPLESFEIFHGNGSQLLRKLISTNGPHCLWKCTLWKTLFNEQHDQITMYNNFSYKVMTIKIYLITFLFQKWKSRKFHLFL